MSSNFVQWYCWLSFTSSYHFQWPWPYFHVTLTGVSNSFNWMFYVLIQRSWNFVGLLSKSSRSWIYQLFWRSHICKRDNWPISSFEIREITDVFPNKTKQTNKQTWLFFQALHDYGLAWSLHCHSRFDDLDFVSKVCQKYKLQISCFGFLSSVV